MVWKFSESLGVSRVNHLTMAPTSVEIVQQVAGEATVKCAHLQSADEVHAHERVIATLEVSRPTFDWFFNSERGYRGSYYTSPELGEHFNRVLIDALAPRLLQFARIEELEVEAFDRSLRGVSAKAWLAEYRDHPLCANCKGEWSAPKNRNPDIINGRWDAADSPLALFGRQAPALSQLRVMGAFVSVDGREFVPAHKRRRHEDLHLFGWS